MTTVACVPGNESVELKAISVNEPELRKHIDGKIKETVEDVLNKLLDAEADALCGARRYERSPDRVDSRAGTYDRGLDTRVGKVNLKVPKLRSLPFETQIIERYRRRESSVEEALVEMYLSGVSVRRVEDITEALWGTRVSPSAVSSLNKRIYEQIEAWRNRPIEGEHPYVYLDGISLKRCWAGEVRNVSVLVAVGVGTDGFREILGVAEGASEEKGAWLSFLRHLKSRGLRGVRLFISDKSLGLVEILGEVFGEALWQRCVVHWYRDVFVAVPLKRRKEVAAMLKAIHAQESREAALKKSQDVVSKLHDLRLSKAAETVVSGVLETLTYMSFPIEHWTRLRTNNPLERIMREIRRRTKVVGSFPDGESALMLVAARLRHMSGTKWGTKKYMHMDRLSEMEHENKDNAA